MTTIAGETVNGVVIEVGENYFRAGFSGDDCPKTIIPSFIGALENRSMEIEQDTDNSTTQKIKESNSKKYYVDTKNISMRRDFMELESLFDKDGIIEKWDHFERLIEYSMKKRLNVTPSEHPIVLNEKTFATKEEREKKIEIMFEKFKSPAVFIAKDPVLTAFATGKSTALVVDSGYNGTVVTPVYEGYALKKSMIRNKFGGKHISEKIYKFFNDKKIVLKPDYLIDKKKEANGKLNIKYLQFSNTSKSYHDYMLMDAINQIKEAVNRDEPIFRVSEKPFSEEQNKNIPTIRYELKDGTPLNIGAERFAIPEILFTPSALQLNSILKQNPIQQSLNNQNFMETTALHLLANESIKKCDADIRKELYGSTILTGGNTMFEGLSRRFEKELSELAGPGMKVKTPISQNQLPVEKKCSVWIGGSILSTIGSFQQMYISKKSYEEYGPSVVHKMCP